MTNPLFRLGHVYAIQGKGHVRICWYTGSENGLYWFLSISTQVSRGFTAEELKKVYHIGTERTDIKI